MLIVRIMVLVLRIRSFIIAFIPGLVLMRSCTSSRRSSGPRAGNGQRPGSDELGTRSELLIIGKMIAGGTTNVICKHYDGGAIWRVLSLQHVPSVDWLLCIVFGSCGLFGHSLQLVIIRCQGGPSRSDHYRHSILLCLCAAFIMASSTGASYTSAPWPSSSAAPQPAAAAPAGQPPAGNVAGWTLAVPNVIWDQEYEMELDLSPFEAITGRTRADLGGESTLDSFDLLWWVREDLIEVQGMMESSISALYYGSGRLKKERKRLHWVFHKYMPEHCKSWGHDLPKLGLRLLLPRWLEANDACNDKTQRDLMEAWLAWSLTSSDPFWKSIVAHILHFLNLLDTVFKSTWVINSWTYATSWDRMLELREKLEDVKEERMRLRDQWARW